MSTQHLEKAEPAQATEPTVTERPPSKQSFMSKVRLREPGPTALSLAQKKALTTILYGLNSMGATWASSIHSPATPSIEKEFHLGSRDSLAARRVGPRDEDSLSKRLEEFTPRFTSVNNLFIGNSAVLSSPELPLSCDGQ
ncbi:Major facilitator superfamily domain general substrate transporter [Penicillium samsonianum]|uniref:Major facilitator superfamily domain general substrate transporter n=1 Tax=Penicillium samsonianum TaxID=1882272 RepID=UPI002546F77C|nr:Major facilitator superfamily domain general substrate transporter [Penicillium samsonianum]KAJ6125414.1 Major facilitator superfamily domain general substrate transporter [Penicillium samsonianum]